MTNHSETTGPSENGDITGRDGRDGCDGRDGFGGPASCDGRTAHGDATDPGEVSAHGGATARADSTAYSDASTHGDASIFSGASICGDEYPYDGPTAYISHSPYDADPPHDADAAVHHVTLRTPGELADALPYLLGYRPEDSIVLVALSDRGRQGRFGGRARLGIPAHPGDWAAVAQQLADGLVKGGERRGTRPAQMVAYLCQDPAQGETGREVMERLQPLAQALRLACGHLDAPVIEALCISDGRFWSYCCPRKGCCPAEGTPMGLPGTSVLAAAATYAGIQVRGTLRELRARLLPLETGIVLEQEVALDTANMAMVPRILDEVSRAAVAEETVELAGRVMRRLAAAPFVSGSARADGRDDELLGCDEAAALILGLQDRGTRDRAAEWMEGDEAAPALRLWRALARRCVGPYREHAAAPLTLAGWVAWSSGDELEAREALAMALGADPGYLFARLLHQACNEGLDPESVRRCLRTEREAREAREPHRRVGDPPAGSDAVDGASVTVPTPAPASGGGPDRSGAEAITDRPSRAQAAEGGEPTELAPGAHPCRARTPTTRPAAASRGRSRPRTAGKLSARRRGNRPQGVRAEGDDARGKG
ncbi:DUF4192 domain-containing protein [Streptomyces sp. NPDC000345]|uniref:DUF4192 domain-containing protein n=1 Tax=Streptomyces sp. NPDC000345 TaxID=3364537 RepID=UPI00369CE2A0